MKIALAQLNCTVGDIEGNAARILDAARLAEVQGARVVLTPELSLTGYPPEDLLLREGFYRACAAQLERLARQLPDKLAVVVGHPEMNGTGRYNAASVLRGGRIEHTYHKHKLPNHSVFDEVRYFTPGSEACVFEVEGVRFGLNICADVWEPGAASVARDAGAEVILVLNASPYHVDKMPSRLDVVRERIRESGVPMVYVNLVGGQDELVFDGASFALDRAGRVVRQLPAFEEGVYFMEFDGATPVPGEIAPQPTTEAAVYQTLCVGVRDYVNKNGFPGVVLGLSGGVDSALTLAVAVDALGVERVRAVMMPSQYTADISLTDAQQMAQTLGVRYDVMPIAPLFAAYRAALASEFAGRAEDTTEENLQARIRGNLLMALSNKYGSIVLTTGNKSEMAVGYCTLYGDMAGGFALLKDVPKTLVYRLCTWRNHLSPVIPERIITRPPSAELRPDQTDQDSLPPYEVLDAIVQAYVEEDKCPRDIVAMGFQEADVRRVVRLVDLNEYKRRQSPVGVRVTHRGFGKDRRYPITSRYKPWTE